MAIRSSIRVAPWIQSKFNPRVRLTHEETQHLSVMTHLGLKDVVAWDIQNNLIVIVSNPTKVCAQLESIRILG